jgi:alpha-beta hydrolase superfamily lysophospholipase
VYPTESRVRTEQAIRLNAGDVQIEANMAIPAEAAGVVLFVHGGVVNRYNPRNQFIAAGLQAKGLGTVLIDLLTPAEERVDQFSGQLRFDISFLARRVTAVVDELRGYTRLPLGLLGASTGAAAALVVAAGRFANIAALVSRGGRVDLAGDALGAVQAPTLFIVGSADQEVLELSRHAMTRMKTEPRLEIVEGASHLFHEPGALETVTNIAADWFTTHFRRRR